MATLQDIKKRITSVKNTQKITRAMKMVAAAKLRRAQTTLVNHRPYALHINQLLSDIRHKTTEDTAHILCSPHQKITNIEYLVFTSNKGLCGSFNTNLLRMTEHRFKQEKENNLHINIHMIGKKGRDYFSARHVPLASVHLDKAERFDYQTALIWAKKLIGQFQNNTIDEAHIIYNRFISSVSHEETVLQILPLVLPQTETKESEKTFCFDFIYEPEKNTLLTKLIEQVLAINLYRAHLESITSELSARMTSMESATNNANDMIAYLTLQYNRARQSAITKELMDIVNGAEALK